MAEKNEPFPLEYAEAFRSTRAAKSVFWWLVGLSILIQLLSFAAVQFFGVIDRASEIAGSTAQPTTAPSSWLAGLMDPNAWYYALQWALPATRFCAMVSAILLAISILLAVKLSLLGRLGGVAGMTSAFFWSLILLAILTPWQRVLGGQLVCGAMFNLGELIEAARKVKTAWGATDVSLLDTTIYYARFLAYPIVALLVWLIVQAKFARGRHLVQMPESVEAQ